MADLSGKTWMAVGETDDPNAVIESYEADGVIAKGAPVELTNAGKVTATPATYNAIGVAVKAVADGVMCPVLKRGRVKVTANGAFSAAGCGVRAAGSAKVTEVYDQAVDEGGAAKYTVYANRKFATALQKALADGDLVFINVER